MKNHISYDKIFIEIVSIILAVILGFLVNEWRENINDKSKAELAFQRIKLEIGQNYSLLKERKKYYSDIVKTIDDQAKSKTKHQFSMESIPGWGGIKPPLLSSSSFMTASSIGVLSFIDFSTVDKISKIYLLQDELQKLGAESINLLISGQLYNRQSVKILFEIYNEIITGWTKAADQLLSNDKK